MLGLQPNLPPNHRSLKAVRHPKRGRLFHFSASRSLHPHQPRAWLRHTPYLRAAQTLKPTCRVCAVRTHAFFGVQTIVSNFQTISNVVWKPLSAKVVWNPVFRRPFASSMCIVAWALSTTMLGKRSRLKFCF